MKLPSPRDLFLITGALSLTTGCAMISYSVGFIAFGVLLLSAAVYSARKH